MNINDISLGFNNPIRHPVFGQVLGDAVVEGGLDVSFARGGGTADLPVRVFVSAPVAIAGFAAGSQAANEALCRWLEELARNGDIQPVLVKWSSLRDLPQDGWWFMSDASPDYTYAAGGAIPVQMTFRQRAAQGAPLGIGWSGGALKSVYTAVPVNLVGVPQSTTGIITATRTGAEGSYSYVLNPPGPGIVALLPGPTVSDLFRAACNVQDAMATLATNPVPGAGFLNANWLQVRGIDHRFVGDLILTNGLLLLTLSLNGSVQLWGWNTATGAWALGGTIQTFDNVGNLGTPIAARLTKITDEEVAAEITYAGAAQTAQFTMRLQRGSRILRIGASPRSYSVTGAGLVRFVPSVGGGMVVYNEGNVTDQQFGATSLPPTAVYPYAAAFLHSASWQWVASLFYQGRTAGEVPAQQPSIPVAGSGIQLGDSAGPAQYQTRFYGIGLTPFANTVNLQAEGEAGTFSGGWVSAVDALASGGNTGRAPTGSLVNAADLFPVAPFTLPAAQAGLYDVAFRVRVLSAASAVAEMEFALWDVTAAAIVGAGTILAPSGVGTTYVWMRTSVAISPPTNGHTLQFRARATGTLLTDWFVDQAVLLPKSLTAVSDGPQDLAQQFLFERTTRFPVV